MNLKFIAGYSRATGTLDPGRHMNKNKAKANTAMDFCRLQFSAELNFEHKMLNGMHGFIRG